MIEIYIPSSGNKYWFLNEHPHRANGPAIVWTNGLKEWHWYGHQVTEYEHMMLAQQKETDNG